MITAFCYLVCRGLKAAGSKKELTKVLQEAMRSEDERDGGEGHKVCKSEDCQCVRDGEYYALSSLLVERTERLVC